MSDEEPEPTSDDVPPTLVMPEPGADVPPDVTLVVPAEACEVIATDQAVAPSPEPTPQPGPAAGLGPVLEAVAALGATLERRLEALQAQFDREVRAEATREKVVDRLHAELQEYKQDLLLGVLRPVFVDLIQLHDDIGKMVAAQGEAEGAVLRLIEVMGGYQQAIEDILDRQGVVPYTQDGTTFDPRRQRAVAAVPTDDPGLARTIAARLRKGFRTVAGDKVIRAEIVSVFALKRESS
jgi:molecular chaperone GrpE